MGLSTERKVFIGILAVAGAALLLDQGLLRPAQAGAAPAESPVGDSSGVSQESVNMTAPQTTTAQVLLDRLAASGFVDKQELSGSLGSSFSLEKLMGSGEQRVSEPTPTDDQQPEPALPVLERDNTDLPSLSAVMPAVSGGGAVLGGKLLRVGQHDANGFKLVEVRERGVIVERDGRLYRIEIPMQVGP